MKLRILFVGVVVCLFATTVLAQDPVKVDPKHYKVESENAQVRILRVHYGAHEKSVMHSHPNAVIVYLTDGNTKMTTPDGKSEERPGKAGEAVFTPAGTHLPENVGDKDFEGILVELKGSKGAAKK
jgi:quercetin dioxygenase-like cupin family protein